MHIVARRLATTSLVVFASFAAMPARAANLEAKSSVDAVTVYPDGASVTRVITLDLPAGDNTLIAKDFPMALDTGSLRVEGEAGAKLTIGAIERGIRARRRRPTCPRSTSGSRRCETSARICKA